MSITLVTALYDIDRKSKGDGRSFDEYLSWFAQTLKVKSPMVIFVEDYLEDFVIEHRKNLPTKIITQPLKQIPYYYLNDDIQHILDDKNFKERISAPSRLECKMSIYNVIIFSKFPWVKRVIEENPFQSEYFMWMDAGLSRFFTPHDVDTNLPYPSESALESLLDNKDSVLIQAQMDFYPDLVNAKEYNDDYFWDARSWVMAGLWGGGSESLSKFCNMVDNVLQEKLIKRGIVNNEQIVMAYIYKTNDDMFTVFENHAHLHRQYEIIAEIQK
jgi:hypothetical protein